MPSGISSSSRLGYGSLNVKPPTHSVQARNIHVDIQARRSAQPATMVYDWEGKEPICYQMYIEEKKSLEEIMQYMRDAHGFAPSKRAFQAQFKKWEFPSKQHPAHLNQELVDRVRELWERNETQKEMLVILNNEGFDIRERELMRVRAKYRWLLRVPNGMKSSTTSKSDGQEDDVALQELAQAMYPETAQEQLLRAAARPKVNPPRRSPSPPIAPEVVEKRRQRFERIQAESDERYKARKRRRRTVGWAGLPADPPGPPRFPSETTIDESKHLLDLNPERYRFMRDQFESICNTSGIIKKTIAGPERWQAAKNQLIQDNEHLQTVFWDNNEQLDQKAQALDVVCMDVTKRLRTIQSRMTIAEAKNTMGINPEQSRQIRQSFYATLKADHFTSKLEAGDDHWKELKEQWIAGSELLQNILAPGDADPHHQIKIKAIEVLCRDVMKRLRDDQTKKDPTRKKRGKGNTVLPSTPVLNPTDSAPTSPNTTQQNTYIRNGISTLASQALASAPAPIPRPDYSDLQIDPSLLLAANNDPGMLTPYPQPPPPTPGPIPIYFRLHPLSPYQPPPNLWLGALPHPPSINVLKSLALSKHAHLGAHVEKIEGVVRDVGGKEMYFALDEDEELMGFLRYVGVGKVTFVVRFVAEGGNASDSVYTG